MEKSILSEKSIYNMNFSLTCDKAIKITLALILIPLGIITKFYSGPGYEFVQNHLGGIIYVIFWILVFSTLFPNYSLTKLSLIVLLITGIIEVTQIIQNPLLNNFRNNFFFRALFGNSFNAEDFLYYIIGALLGFVFTYIIKRVGEKKIR